eukprot:2503960-Prymnesium_polylepis.1
MARVDLQTECVAQRRGRHVERSECGWHLVAARFGGAQQHGHRLLITKLPLAPRGEEARQQRARGRVGVELANASTEHRPSDAAREAELVLIDTAPLRPKLDRLQRLPEVSDVGHEARDGGRDAHAVDGVHVGLGVALGHERGILRGRQ